MPVFPRKTRRNFHAAIGGALISATLILAMAPARAEEDSIEQKMMDGLMGAVGLSRKDSTIEYRERSPLVLPQGDALPAPESNKVSNPNWPIEPEVKKARALAAAEREGSGRTSSERIDDAMRPLSRAELDKGRTNRKQNNPNKGEDGMFPSSWSELGYHGGLFGNAFTSAPDLSTSFTGESPRTSLITPPSGYQTPSPAQPYAVGKSQYKDKAVDYYGERGYDK